MLTIYFYVFTCVCVLTKISYNKQKKIFAKPMRKHEQNLCRILCENLNKTAERKHNYSKELTSIFKWLPL